MELLKYYFFLMYIKQNDSYIVERGEGSVLEQVAVQLLHQVNYDIMLAHPVDITQAMVASPAKVISCHTRTV